LNRYIFLGSLIIILFSGCSTKEVFEPENVDKEYSKEAQDSQTIIDVASTVALLQENKVLTKDALYDISIDEDKRVISDSDKWIITASIDGNMTLISKEDSNTTKNIELKKTVAGASVEDDTLAVIFADNEIALYSISTKETLFKEQDGKYTGVDYRVVNPHFMKGLVIFSTLNGTIAIVNKETKKRLRTVIVSSEDTFNNIISLHMMENKIIAATTYEILSLAQKEHRVKYEIRDITYDDKMIYIATKQGEIISLTPNLEVVQKIKLPFAHFYGLIEDGDKLYSVEKEGYMIIVDKKTFEYTIERLEFDNEGFVFIGDKSFYIADKKIPVK
jgi:WD40 repeat protein